MALCDLDVTKLHKISDQHGIKRRTTSAQEILTDHSIDVVSICSYDDQHTGQAITGLEHGKNLMVEKPLCLFPEDSERIVKAWEGSKVVLTSNLILRASPGFVKLKEMIDDGMLGMIFCIEGDYLYGRQYKITEGWRGDLDFYCKNWLDDAM